MMKRVGPYELLEELGRGGMGAVYRARRSDGTGLQVALKVLLSPLADPEERARFEREARALSGFRHPGIVAIHDAGVSPEGRAYLALAFQPGGALHGRLKTEGRLPSREAAEVLLALAEAVEHAHAKGVLHRDLKPHNVLFDEDGRPVLTDFGLARMTQWDERLTATGEVLGTPAYMAPEQATGERERIGPASDVYGLGATLYAMLCGRPPFRGGSLLAVLDQVLNAPPPPLPGAVDADLQAICLKCLAKEPADRYPSAAALAQALQEWLAGRSAAGGGAGRLRVGVAVGLLSVGVAVGVGLAATRGPASSPVAVSTPAPTPTAGLLPSPRSEPTPAASATSTPRPAKSVAGIVREAKEHWASGRRKKALLAWWSAVWLEPSRAEHRVELARVLVAMDGRMTAYHQLLRAWRLDRRSLSQAEREGLGRWLLAQRRYAAAVPVLEAAVMARPTAYDLRRVQALALWELRQPRQAFARLDELLRVLPAAERERRAEAEELIASFRRTAAQAEERSPRETDTETFRLVEQATERMRGGGWGAAKSLLEQAAQRRRSPTVLRFLTQVALMQRELPAALELAREALRFSPTPEQGGASAWIVATVHGTMNRQELALAFLNQAVDLDPRGLPEALAQRGMVRFSAGFEEGAFEDFRRALRADPNRLAARVGVGWANVRAGRYAAVVDEVPRLLRRLPETEQAPVLELHAEALVGLKRFGRARTILDGLRTILPNSHRVHFTRARMLWFQGERVEALKEQQAGLDKLKVTHPVWALEQTRLDGWRIVAPKSGPR